MGQGGVCQRRSREVEGREKEGVGVGGCDVKM